MKSLETIVIYLIWTKPKETNKTIYFIIDDAISEKTNLSSKALFCVIGYNYKIIFNATVKAAYIYINELKTNIIIYPNDHYKLEIKLHPFTKHLIICDFNICFNLAQNDFKKTQIVYIYNATANGNPI